VMLNINFDDVDELYVIRKIKLFSAVLSQPDMCGKTRNLRLGR